MSITNFIRAMSAALVAIFLIGALIASSRIDAIRMGGPMHAKSVQAADLVADILPPPEYIIEPYLEASLLLADARSLGERRRKLSDLKRAYDDRKHYWESSDLDPELLDIMRQRSDPAAQRFWGELEGSFLPAIGAGDSAAAQASYARLTNAYAEHRSAIDALVEKATAYQAKVKDQASSALSWAVVLLAALAAILVSVVGAFYWGLIHRVLKPIVELSTATKALADGEARDVPHRDRTDELGLIARAVGQFRDAAQARAEADARNAAEQQVVTSSLRGGLGALTDCDLTAQITADFPPAYAELKTNFNEALASLRTLIGSVMDSAATIRTGSSEIAQASEDLARRTESNAASLEETSAAVTQMDGRLKATAESAGRTVERADGAIATVSGGRSIADEAVQAMTRVADSAKGIDNVIEGLDKIAFQTRVLAMNAAVEAGRAGEAGRGFAVVADLVSALAMRAEEEAGRARDQLTATQTDIVAAVEMVQKVDNALANISSDVSEVHTLLGQIAADNQAQSTAITQISVAIGTMDQSTQQNAAMVEQTSAAARNLTGEVASLSEQAAKFTIGGERRLSVVRVSAPAQPAKAYVSPVKALPVAAMANDSGNDDWTSF